MLFLAWARKYIAWNHLVRGKFVEWKMVSSVKDVCLRQILHWKTLTPTRMELNAIHLHG